VLRFGKKEHFKTVVWLSGASVGNTNVEYQANFRKAFGKKVCDARLVVRHR
jgi:hypothetical protein